MLAGIVCSNGASGVVRTSAGSRPTRSSAKLLQCAKIPKQSCSIPRYRLNFSMSLFGQGLGSLVQHSASHQNDAEKV